MIAPPAGLVTLDRDTLLKEILLRLDGSAPPGDAAYALVEEISRFAEALAGRLDALPAELLQAAASALGVELRPALPAVALILATPKAEGALQCRDEVDATTFVAPRSETRGPVPFVPCERRVNLVTGGLSGWTQTRDGELFAADTPPSGLLGWRPTMSRATAFDAEQVRYTVHGPDREALRGALTRAISGLARRRIGWLHAEIIEEPDGFVLVATVAPSAQARRVQAHSASLVLADWGTLDGLEWRPLVHINPSLTQANGPRVTMNIGGDGRTLEIWGVPPDAPLDDLLIRAALSAPHSLVDALWRTLRHQALDLPVAPTSARRDLTGAASGSWIEVALRAGRWPPVRTQGSTFITLRPERTGTSTDTVRFALAFDADETLPPRILAFGRAGDTLTPLPTDALRPAWRLPLPASDGQVDQVMAWDLSVPAELSELILAVEGVSPRAVMVNALLAVNAPRLTEGLRVPIRALGGLEVQLRGRDLVSPRALEALQRGALFGAEVPALEPGAFPLARFLVEGAAPLNDLGGLRVDEMAGRITLPGVDSDQGERSLIPGQVVELTWYRRTDGASGVLPAGAVSGVEQLAAERTRLSRALQPYPTVGGCGAETAASAQGRALTPTRLAPVLPLELERDVRDVLGQPFDGWLVRVHATVDFALGPTWGWAELPTPEGDEPSARSSHPLRSGQLRVALGPPDRVATDAELVDARLRLQGWFQGLAGRYPQLERLELTGLRPLTLWLARPMPQAPALPLYDLDGLAHADRLVDPTGTTRCALPLGRLEDAVITAVRGPASRDPWQGDELARWLRDELRLSGWTLNVRIWTRAEIDAQNASTWGDCEPVRPAELTRHPWPAELQPGVEPELHIALGAEGAALDTPQLEALREVVRRWARRVWRRWPELGETLPVAPLRFVRQPDPRGAPELLEDAWGEQRRALAGPLLDAVLVEDPPGGAPGRPREVQALSAELEAILAEAGWRWLARLWLPGDADRLKLVAWNQLPRVVGPSWSPPRPVARSDLAWLALGPPTGMARPADRDAVLRHALRWWDRVRPRCVGVHRLEVLKLHPLRALTPVPDRAPLRLPSAWTADLGAEDQLIDASGERRVPLGQLTLLDAVITSVERSGGAHGD